LANHDVKKYAAYLTIMQIIYFSFALIIGLKLNFLPFLTYIFFCEIVKVEILTPSVLL